MEKVTFVLARAVTGFYLTPVIGLEHSSLTRPNNAVATETISRLARMPLMARKRAQLATEAYYDYR